MKENSFWEKNKYDHPCVIGLIIWVTLIIILAFNIPGEGNTGNFGFIVIFSLLIVGVPTVIVEIVLVYVFKVVKMKPKSSYDIGNINDCIALQERFRSGNYEYGTIGSKEDLFRAYEAGKKIVFTALPRGKALIWIGVILSIAGLILGGVLVIVFGDLPLDAIVFVFVSSFSVSTGIGAIFFIPGIFNFTRLPRSFFVLTPEGIVYRRVIGGVVSYSWKELRVRVYSVTTTLRGLLFLKMELPTTIELHIILPNGSLLKFRPYDYNLDEFLNLEKFVEKLGEKTLPDRKNIKIPASVGLKMEQATFALVFMTFKFYKNPSKGQFDRPSRQKIQRIRRERGKNQEQILNYLKMNSGNAYTIQSLYNRIEDLGLNEEAKNNLDLDALNQILDDLSVGGKIVRQEKEGKTFYFS